MLLPLSLLKVTQSFRALKPGETLEVLLSESESSQELFKVLPHASYEVTAMEAQGRSNPHYCIQLQKKNCGKASKPENTQLL
jgi:TusA-related sulfurtransferase